MFKIVAGSHSKQIYTSMLEQSTPESIALRMVYNIVGVTNNDELTFFCKKHRHDTHHIFAYVRMVNRLYNHVSQLISLNKSSTLESRQTLVFVSVAADFLKKWSREFQDLLMDSIRVQSAIHEKLLLRNEYPLSKDHLAGLVEYLYPLASSIHRSLVCCHSQIDHFRSLCAELIIDDNLLYIFEYDVSSAFHLFNQLYTDNRIGSFMIDNESIDKAAHYHYQFDKLHIDVSPITLRINLESLIFNLLQNSLDHGFSDVPKSVKKQVSIVGQVNADNSYTITYSDNGVGISKEDLVNVFAEGLSTKDGNLGMAMSYWKNYLNSLGAQFSVESTVGQGTTFIIKIPQSLFLP